MLSFGLQEAAPGDPARLLLQASGVEFITDADVASVRRELGFDRPLPERYLTWLARVLHGDLGSSYLQHDSVLTLFAQRVPNTALLALCASMIALMIALPLGMLSAFHKGSWLDRGIQGYVALGGAIPGFWLALLLILTFASTLKWLPAFGSPTIRGIILPAVVLSMQKAVILTRLVRTSTLDTLGQPWLLTARAKGLPGRILIRRHLLPAVITPVLVVSGLEVANLLTGAAVVEYVFAWPGIGKLAVDSVLGSDMPMVVAFSLFAGVVFVCINLLVDLLSAMMDPRMRTKS
jgi:peptide/nickel transport system permease protein